MISFQDKTFSAMLRSLKQVCCREAAWVLRKAEIMGSQVDVFGVSCLPSKSNQQVQVRFSGVNHLAMATGDMDKTIRFWRDLLGMRLVAGLGQPGYRHYFFEISKTDLLAFFEWPGVKPVQEKDHGQPVSGRFIFDHVSFGVETEEDLWALKDKLSAAGFWVSDAIDHGFIHSIYAFDPNGIPIEFSHNVEGVDVRKNPSMKDTAPSAVTREGPTPHPEKWPPVTAPTPREERAVYPGAGSELFHGIKKT